MNDRDHEALSRYCRQIADKLGLRDWTLEVLREPCDDDNYAVCDPTYGRKLAQISFCRDFQNHDADTQRHTVVHELLHCVFASEQDHVRMHLLKHLAQSTYDVFNDTYRQMHEYAVDGLADAIAPLMPQILWSQEAER